MNVIVKDKQLELLIGLQEIDQEIQKLNRLKEKIPGEIEREKQIFKKIDSEEKQLKEKIDQAQKMRRSKEQETQSVKENLVKTKEKLPSVKNNKEYSALLQEIENFEHKIISEEDAEIELMESIEKYQEEYSEKLKEKNEEEQKFIEIKRRKGEDLEKLNKLLEEESNHKNELIGGVETKWLSHYEKVTSLRRGQAVVVIDNDTCQGCYQSLMPQLSIEVRKNDSIITCPYCSRFLFSEKVTGVD